MSIETLLRDTRLSGDVPATDPSLQSPGSFTVSTMLMQDAVPADGVSVGAGAHNQEALFANPFKDGREEALVVNNKSELTYLERTDSSDTGWVQTVVPGLPAVAEVVTAVHPSGDVWAICSPQDDNAKVFGLVLALGERQPDGTARCSWVGRTDFDKTAAWARSLCVTYAPDSGPLVLGTSLNYTGGGTIFVLTPRLPAIGGGPAWVIVGSSLPGTGYPAVGGGFLPYYGATGQRNVFVYYFLNGPELIRWEESGGRLSGPFVISKTVDQFCGSYYVPNLNRDNPQGDVGFAFLDGIYLVTGSYMTPGHHLMMDAATDTGFDPQAEARVWQDADGRLHVFGMDQAGSLQVLHQTTWQTAHRGVGPDQAQVVQPAWTSARVAGAPEGIGGYDLKRPNDRIVAFDYAGTGSSDHLLAYRPGPDQHVGDGSVFVVARTKTPGQFDAVLRATAGLPGYDFSSANDRVVAYDYRESGSANHILAYRPGAGKFSILRKQDGADAFVPVVWADSGGIGKPGLKYDLNSTEDRIEPFDYTGSGKNSHLLAYRPGTGTAWVLAPLPDGTFDAVVRSSTGLGGFTLNNTADIVVGFDYDGSGSNTHLLAYRPATGMVYILAPDGKGGFTAVVKNDTGGIGGYDLKNAVDRLLPFDYTGLGNNDHLLAYRPGHRTAWILKRIADTNRYEAVVQSSTGLGGYDFANAADRVTGYDYNGTDSLSYLVAYRPSAGKVSVMGQRGGGMTPVYQAPPAPATIVTVGVHALVTNFQLDPYPDYKPSELIKMSGNTDAEAYCICTQDVTTSAWQTDKVRVPPAKTTQDPYIVSHYVADATLLSKQGRPLAGHTVSVSADSLVEVQIDAVSYQVGPGRAISVTTNATGKLVVSIAARGLNPPVVHLNADGLESGTAIDFAAQANDFLAGKGTLPSQADRFTPDLLEHAQVTPDAPGLRASDLADWPALKERGLTPQVVVDHCTNMYAQAADHKSLLRLTLAGSDQPQPVVGYVIQLWDPDRPAFQVFRTQDELDAYKAYREGHPSYGGWWDDFTNWASDVWEGIKTGAQKVAEVIVSTVVEIAVWIGNAVVSLGEMIVETIQQAIQAVEAVFQMIADAIMRVIDWLKALFAFKDIWETKKALTAGLKQVIGYTASTAEHFADIADNWFKEQEQRVREIFADAKAQFGDVRISDTPNKVPPARDASGGTVNTNDVKSNPQGNWLLNQMHGQESRHPGSFNVTMSPATSRISTAWDEFMRKWEQSKVGDSLGRAADDIGDLLANLFDPGGRTSPGNTSVVLVLDVLENLIIAFLEAVDLVIQALFTFAITTLKELESALFSELNFGFLNTIYRWIQGLADEKDVQDATVADLFLLGAAFILTFVAKLINGVNYKPFEGGTFPDIQPPPWHPGQAVSVPFDDPDSNRRLVTLQLLGNVVAGLFAGGFGGWTDGYWGPSGQNMPESPFATWGNAVATVFGCVFMGFPWFYGVTDWNTLAVAPWAVWCIFTAPCIGTIVGLNVSFKNCENFAIGPLGTTGFGLTLLVLYCMGNAAAKASPMTWAATVLAPLPSVTQVIRWGSRKIPNPVAGFAVNVVTAVVNAIMNFTSYLLNGLIASQALNSSPVIDSDQTPGTPAVGMDYSYRIKYSSGNGDVLGWELTKTSLPLPAGLDLDAASGAIHGAPTSVSDQPRSVTVQVHDSYGPPLYASPTDVALPAVQATPVGGLAKSVGDGQLAAGGTTYAVDLVAKVTNSQGQGLSGAVVTFTAPAEDKVNPKPFGTFTQDDGTTGATSRAVSDGLGFATAARLTAGSVPGKLSITANVPGVGTASVVFDLTVTATTVARIDPDANGASRTVTASTAVSPALGVVVGDKNQAPVADVLVSFTVNPSTTGAAATFTDDSGNRTFAWSKATDQQGAVTAATLTANDSAGPYTVTAAIPGIPGLQTVFQVTNEKLQPASAEPLGGPDRNVVAGTQLSGNLSVKVTDSTGGAYRFATVTFTATTGGGGATGTFPDPLRPGTRSSTYQTTTDTNGIATAGDFLANQQPGSYQVTATVFGYTNVGTAFNITNISG